MSTHPVWGVYDLYRTARLNVKYFSVKLDKLEKVNLTMELTLALTAPSSAVAGLWFWSTNIGGVAWKTLGVVTAIVAVAKPIINIPKKIKAYSEALSTSRALEQNLFEITESIKQNQKYDREAQNEFKKALKRKGVLATNDPEAKHDASLIQKLTAEVNKELPPDSFYIPSE